MASGKGEGERNQLGTPDESGLRKSRRMPKASEVFSDEELLSDDASLRSPTLGSPDMLGDANRKKRKQKIKKEAELEQPSASMDLDSGGTSEPLAKLLSGSLPKSAKGKNIPGAVVVAKHDILGSRMDLDREADAATDVREEHSSEESDVEENDLLVGEQVMDARAEPFGNIMFVQLPSVVPKVRNTAPEENDVDMEPAQEPTGNGQDDDEVRETTKKPPRRDFIPLDEFHGRCGKLIVRKSGRVTLQLSTGLEYRLSKGSSAPFLQHIVDVETGSIADKLPIKVEPNDDVGNGILKFGDAMVLGRVKHRFVAAPDVSSLLNSLTMS
jgi:hypothetical protein